MTIFKEPYSGQQLSLAIIDARNQSGLRYALYNMAHVYGNTDASLYAFHGLDNEQLVRDIVSGWTGVRSLI
jgi:hypothetical protein